VSLIIFIVIFSVAAFHLLFLHVHPFEQLNSIHYSPRHPTSPSPRTALSPSPSTSPPPSQTKGRTKNKMSQSQSHRLFRIHKTIQQMVHDRGYTVPHQELHMELATWEQRRVERAQLTFVAIHPENEEDRIIVFYPEEEPIGIGIIRK